MNKEIMIINNVRGYQDEKGMANLNLEDVARGLGFTQCKGNIEYIRWERVKGYLDEIGFPTCGENGKVVEYIPENIFYKLCFKAENEVARKFQDIVTDEVLPSIRKHGAYLTNTKIEEVLLNPDTIIKLAMDLKEERKQKEQLQLENAQSKQIIGELKPKADYTDTILKNKGLVTMTAIAKDYGMSANKMNDKLNKLGVQYKQSRQWFLYTKYQDKGYTHSETVNYKHKDGRDDIAMNTKWTQKGRLFLYNLLKENGLVPVIER